MNLSQSIDDNYVEQEFYNTSFEPNDPRASNPRSSSSLLDSVFQSIKCFSFQPNLWYSLYDENYCKIETPKFEVYADKGFNFSSTDDVFICQKKNHFQITTNIHPIKFNTSKNLKPNKLNDEKMIFIRIKNETGVCDYKKVKDFFLNFHGVKVESPNQTIKVEQSQSDRSKRPFLPIKLSQSFLNGQMIKNTMGRLHFAETTSGNMRKKGKPNPDQKFFYLVASLIAQVDEKHYTIISLSSERIIVRASNPGQFENDAESCWIKSQFGNDCIFHNGNVGINTDNPEEALVVNGNFRLTGTLLHPSDQRIKRDIQAIETNQALINIARIKLYSYNYSDDYKENYLKDVFEGKETGVLAQELLEILPDAVKNSGRLKLNEFQSLDNFLVVNKDRLFLEGIGAIKELILVTSKMNSRINELKYFEQLIKKDLFQKSDTPMLINFDIKPCIFLLIVLIFIMLYIVGFSQLIKFN